MYVADDISKYIVFKTNLELHSNSIKFYPKTSYWQ